MRVLLDTNILLRIGSPSHSMHQIARDAVSVLKNEGYSLSIVPQVLYEYWVVATRPTENNGLGLNVTDAAADLADWGDTFKLLLDERGIFASWSELVRHYNVLGKNAHDARLVAAMQKHQLKAFLTFNKHDFTRFPMLNILTPPEILDGVRFDPR